MWKWILYFLQLWQDIIISLFSEDKSGDSMKDEMMEEKNRLDSFIHSTNSFLLQHVVQHSCQIQRHFPILNVSYLSAASDIKK